MTTFEALNKQIRDLELLLKRNDITPFHRDNFEQELMDARYDRSSMLADDLSSEDKPGKKIKRVHTTEIEPFRNLMNRMIDDGIVETLKCIVEKKKKNGKPQKFKQGERWVMDKVLPEEKLPGFFTFEDCCEIRGFNPENIRYCIYAMSRKTLPEVLEFIDFFRSNVDKNDNTVFSGFNRKNPLNMNDLSSDIEDYASTYSE